MIRSFARHLPGRLKVRLRRGLEITNSRIVNAALAKPSLPFHNSIRSKLRLSPAKALSSHKMSSYFETHQLNAETEFFVESPAFENQRSKCYRGKMSPVKAYCAEDAIVSAYSPALVCDEKIFLPPSVVNQDGRITTEKCNLFRAAGRNNYVSHEAELEIKFGIHAGGAGAFNWYHFLIECLPKVFLSQRLPPEYDDFPILLPEECMSVPSFSSAVEAMAKGRAQIYLSRKQRARCRRIVVMDEISFGPYNMRAGEWPRVDDYFQHDAELKAFISELREGILSTDLSAGRCRRIFLARPGTRRNYNQAELINISSRYGFEPIFPEQLSLSEQAKLFSEASYIIGASGAAWAGLVFCRERVTGLSWLPSVYSEFCSYSTLAHLLGHRLKFLEVSPQCVLRTTGDVYNMSYAVCPLEFENALQTLLDDTEI